MIIKINQLKVKIISILSRFSSWACLNIIITYFKRENNPYIYTLR